MILAITGLLLDHAPPASAVNKEMVLPWQTADGPETGLGNVLTVTTMVAIHPVDNVYVIVTVPLLTPVTTPALFTVAVAMLLLLQLPPDALLNNVVVLPGHTSANPLIEGGSEFTVTTAVVKQPVGNV